MTIPLSDMKWTYRSKDDEGRTYARPEYRTKMSMYHTYQKLGTVPIGINCPKCKVFVPDSDLTHSIASNHDYVQHDCGVDLIFDGEEK